MLGLDVFLEDMLSQLKGKRIGIVTNHTGLTSDLKHIVDVLYLMHKLDVRVLFSPEHGIRGDLPPGVEVRDYIDSRTGLPVYSLYSSRREPPYDVLQKLDVIIYDIQDVGARFYTYISTLFYVIKAVGMANKELIVLDRPNPITGSHIEGPVLDMEFRSFIGIWSIPIRYGLTPGELALYFNDVADLKADITVVRMRGWKRDMWYDETGLIWVPPSPNIPTLDSAMLYPGTCLFEGTNISEGRGTTRPFEVIGAPWIDEYKLLDALSSFKFEGVILRPMTFIPMFSKYSGEVCHGIQIHVVDRERLEPISLSLYIMNEIRRQNPRKFKWIVRGRRYHFDLLIGRGDVRRALDSGEDLDALIKDFHFEAEKFKREASRFFLYE